MKNIYNNTLKIIFISFVVLLSSCEKDLYEDALTQNKKDYKYGRVSFNQVKQKNPRIVNAINNIKTNLNNSIDSKKTTNLYGFEVDTTNIMYIEKQDGYKSYSLKIEQETGLHYFKNLVLNEFPDGILKISMVKFNLTKSIEQIKLENSLNESIINKEVSKYSLENNTMGFYSCIEVGYYHLVISCEGDLVTPEENPSCFNSDGTRAWHIVFEIIEQSCGFNGGGTSESGNNGPEVAGPSQGEFNGGGVADDEIFIANPYSDTEAQTPGSMLIGPAIAFFESKLDKETELPKYLEHRELRDYLANNNCNENARQFVSWAISYLIEHPLINFEKFKNWFMMPKEGIEATELLDVTFLSSSPQPLPTFDNFLLAYPSHVDPNFESSEQIYTNVGGAVLTKYNQGARNTCALRISRGLNNAGVTIPNIPGVTVKGADNKNYFLVAKNLLAWMKVTFGTPTGSNHLTGTDGGENGQNFPNLLNGKQGIYIMIPNYPTLFEASGHADMFFNGDCDGGCYFNATGGVKEIFFWELN
jgi:hypothetical protein